MVSNPTRTLNVFMDGTRIGDVQMSTQGKLRFDYDGVTTASGSSTSSRV